jgi:hypothetical protein
MRLFYSVQFDTDDRNFHLFLHNEDTGRKLELAVRNSKDALKTRLDMLFGPGIIHWCNGDDPHYDSTESFVI